MNFAGSGITLFILAINAQLIYQQFLSFKEMNPQLEVGIEIKVPIEVVASSLRSETKLPKQGRASGYRQ